MYEEHKNYFCKIYKEGKKETRTFSPPRYSKTGKLIIHEIYRVRGSTPIEPSFRRSSNGRIEGYGLVKFPIKGW